MILIGEAERRTIRSSKRCFSVCSSCQRSNNIACHIIVGNIGAVTIVSRCRIQIKHHTFQRITVLVYLFYAVVERRLKVETHLQAGIVISALQIKQFQAVIGTGREYLCSTVIGRPMDRIRLLLPQCFYKHVIDCGYCIARHAARAVRQSAGSPALSCDDLPRTEINGTVQLAVDAAQIQHQHVVYENPDVVVSGKLKDHILLAG